MAAETDPEEDALDVNAKRPIDSFIGRFGDESGVPLGRALDIAISLAGAAIVSKRTTRTAISLILIFEDKGDKIHVGSDISLDMEPDGAGVN